MKILVIGGVAGGASAAARARRLNEHAEIVVVERGAEPSFANCGLPYYVGGEIESRQKLLVAPAEQLRQRHRLDVRVRQEAIKIDRKQKSVEIRDLTSGEVYQENYEKLIIATGASPFRPNIPGMDGPRIFALRDLADADRLHSQVSQTRSTRGRAIVVGAGFIGIEVAENLVRRGWSVTIIELADQILPPWDEEMVRPLERHLRDQGVELVLGDSVEALEHGEADLRARLRSGKAHAADFAVVCIGVRPESKLAADAGIACGERQGILTNEHMQTNDPDVYAVGDVVQVTDIVSQQPAQIPLAGPANRQGRIAADHIFGRPTKYRGTLGTAVVGVFGQVAAMTGNSEKRLAQNSQAYEKVYIHPNNHAGYYPGATQMTLKLLFAPQDGKILGAQAVGGDGVDKRIDVIAMAMQGNMTVYDLEDAELCYAPQFGSAKDPVNMIGFVAAGVLRGDQPIVHFRTSETGGLHPPSSREYWLLDVRTPQEFAAGHLPDATNIPLETLRDQLSAVPTDRPIAVYCKVGQRGYMATRVLQHHGFDAFNVSGGYLLREKASP